MEGQADGPLPVLADGLEQLEPVHGELSDQGDVRVVRRRLVLVVQEVQVGPVHGEALSPELVTQVILVQLGQLLLELKGRRGGLGTGKPARGPRSLSHALPSPEFVTAGRG